MTNAELLTKLKAEIESLKSIEYPCDNSQQATGFFNALDRMTDFLSTLESEKPMNPEAAMKELEEKIALVKQRGTWDGVDVDKYMDEVRGREPEKPMNQDELEKAVVDYFEGYWPGMETAEQCNTDLRFTPPAIMRLARHFAEWGADHTPLPEDTVIYNKGVEEGKRLMMEEAVETELYWDGDFLAIDLNMAALGYSERDKVRVIVIPNTDKK